MTVYSHSLAHIDANIRVMGTREWHFTGFYDHLETARRGDSWTLLKRLQRHNDMPWLVGRDFNEILEGTEKSGRIERHWYQMETFARHYLIVLFKIWGSKEINSHGGMVGMGMIVCTRDWIGEFALRIGNYYSRLLKFDTSHLPTQIMMQFWWSFKNQL